METNRATFAAKEADLVHYCGAKRQFKGGIFYQLKNGCNWCDLPKDLPPYSTVFWYYKQWRETGALDEIIDKLHGKVREQAQKNRSGQP
jgi:transposase